MIIMCKCVVNDNPCGLGCRTANILAPAVATSTPSVSATPGVPGGAAGEAGGREAAGNLKIDSDIELEVFQEAVEHLRSLPDVQTPVIPLTNNGLRPRDAQNLLNSTFPAFPATPDGTPPPVRTSGNLAATATPAIFFSVPSPVLPPATTPMPTLFPSRAAPTPAPTPTTTAAPSGPPYHPFLPDDTTPPGPPRGRVVGQIFVRAVPLGHAAYVVEEDVLDPRTGRATGQTCRWVQHRLHPCQQPRDGAVQPAEPPGLALALRLLDAERRRQQQPQRRQQWQQQWQQWYQLQPPATAAANSSSLSATARDPNPPSPDVSEWWIAGPSGARTRRQRRADRERAKRAEAKGGLPYMGNGVRKGAFKSGRNGRCGNDSKGNYGVTGGSLSKAA
ncbi:hypothetical protein VTI28DRAFT_7078 [Corynascus sepedonium]